MTNPTATNDGDLITACQDIATGETAIGTAAGFAQNKSPNITADVNALLAAREAVEVAKGTLTTYREVIRTVAGTGRELMSLTRDVFKPRLGSEFSDPWKLVGFEDSLAMPKTPAQVQLAVRTLQKYLESNPTFEVAALNITAANAGTLFTQLSNARGAVYNQERVVGTLIEAREAAAEKLRRRFRGFIDEANQLLGPLDPRWKAFGLNMPGAKETPDVPTNVSVVLVGPTAAAAKWGASARADYYRVWMKLHGSTEDYTAMGSPADLDFTLENLPTASELDIAISSVNDGGESALSEPVKITTQA